MKETPNKKVVDELQQYFLNQDYKTICRLLSNCMLDYHRLANFNELPDGEKISLNARIKLNSIEVGKFVKNGPDGNIKISTLEF